jgi:uncharacterized protein YndB with AHSA1/START domain
LADQDERPVPADVPKLYVDKSLEIDASSSRIWEILTFRTHTREWASEFTAGGPQLHIESEWAVGSSVWWKDQNGATVVEGTATARIRHTLLRFTVIDAHGARRVVGAEDGITFKLTERGGKTILCVSQGDFSTLPDGARYRDLTERVWERALPRITRLAEGH